MRTPSRSPTAWWTSPWLLAALTLAATIPLLWPQIPPLTDLPGHMGRYRIELADPASVLRTRFFDFRWSFVANLGVDLLIIPMAKLFGLELGLKLIVIAMPALTVAGLLWIAREVHGEVPAPALFVLPFAYPFPLIWGFLNYILAMALALNAFALWLRLGRQRRFGLRAALFVPIGCLITVVHVFGWAVLGLLAFAGEAVREREAGRGIVAGVVRGGLACLPLAPPLVLLAAWQSGGATADTAGFFNWSAKWTYLRSALRAASPPLDTLMVDTAVVLILFGIARRWLVMNRLLGFAALLLTIAYILLPRILLGSAYADMRLAPYLLMVALIGLSLERPSPRAAAITACAAIAIFVVRLAVLTTSFAAHDRANAAQLAALDHVPRHARIFVMVRLDCLSRWETSRMEHLGAMAIVRRDAFANGQWAAAGAQLLTITYAREAPGYVDDPTQLVRPARCTQRGIKRYPDALYALPRQAFDYVWLIDMPREREPDIPWLAPVWRGPASGVLYRVLPATTASETPAGNKPRAAP